MFLFYIFFEFNDVVFFFVRKFGECCIYLNLFLKFVYIVFFNEFLIRIEEVLVFF